MQVFPMLFLPLHWIQQSLYRIKQIVQITLIRTGFNNPCNGLGKISRLRRLHILIRTGSNNPSSCRTRIRWPHFNQATHDICDSSQSLNKYL